MVDNENSTRIILKKDDQTNTARIREAQYGVATVQATNSPGLNSKQH